MCFIPCCGSKYASGVVDESKNIISECELPNTWQSLNEGRIQMRYCIDEISVLTTAIRLYTGSPYNTFTPHLERIIESLRQNKLKIVIISAGYGIIDALEPINQYEAKMEGRVATQWIRNGLPAVITELLNSEKPTHVFGFFAGTTIKNTPGAKYRYIFTEGAKRAINKGDIKPKSCGCFYRSEGMGVKAILGALGRTFIDLYTVDFNENIIRDIELNGRVDSNIQVRYDNFLI